MIRLHLGRPLDLRKKNHQKSRMIRIDFLDSYSQIIGYLFFIIWMTIFLVQRNWGKTCLFFVGNVLQPDNSRHNCTLKYSLRLQHFLCLEFSVKQFFLSKNPAECLVTNHDSRCFPCINQGTGAMNMKGTSCQFRGSWSFFFQVGPRLQEMSLCHKAMNT